MTESPRPLLLALGGVQEDVLHVRNLAAEVFALREVKQPVPGHTAVIISGGCSYNSGLPYSRVLITHS